MSLKTLVSTKDVSQKQEERIIAAFVLTAFGNSSEEMVQTRGPKPKLKKIM